MKNLIVALFALLALNTIACDNLEDEFEDAAKKAVKGDGYVCEPGAVQQCFCPGDVDEPTGAQRCNTNGRFWWKCYCSTTTEGNGEFWENCDGCGSGDCGEEEELEPVEEDTDEELEPEVDTGDETGIDDTLWDEDDEVDPQPTPDGFIRFGTFDIMEEQITVDDYLECNDALVCHLYNGGACGSGFTNAFLRNDGTQAANCLNWGQAEQYCRWRGMRLPTLDEWEVSEEYTTDSGYQDWLSQLGLAADVNNTIIYDPASLRPEVGVRCVRDI